MTNAEKQEIIEAVLAALATNSKTIAQLSPKQSLIDSDLFEVAGGSRVTYQLLRSLIREGLALESQLSNYVTGDAAMMYLAKLDTETGTVDYTESPLVMLDGFKGVNGYTPVTGDLYYENRSGYQIWIKAQGGATGVHANTHVAYVNKNDGAIYRWTGSSMVRIGGSAVINDLVTGGEADALSAEQGKVLKGLIDNIGTGSIAAFSQYAVFESVSALPATGVSTTGYIVGNHIYAYVGTGGDTRDGKYQDLGALEAAGVSVTTAEDGTFTIHAGGNDYTVNLNHTHPNMCKLVVCEESGLPSTLAKDTIYAQVNDADNPTEIETLYIAGLEFTGGGLPAGVPQISKPTNGSTVNLATISGQSGATGTVAIKGRSLTAPLTVSVGNGFSLAYGQQSGSSVTIPAADAIIGCNVTVNATAYGTEGTMMIVSQTDNISVAVDLTSDVIEDLEGVKLTGSQWLDTDYHTNPQTKIVMDCLFEKNAITENQSYSGDRGQIVINCRDSSESALILQTGQPTEQIAKAYSMQVWLQRSYNASAYNHFYEHIFGSESAFCKRSILTIDAPNKYISFQGVSWATDAKTNTQTSTLSVGRSQYSNMPFNQFDLTVYSLKLYDGGTLVRDYSPKRINGVVGMLDAVSGGFMASGTQTPLEPVVSQS